ncbi:MAG: PPOX class F420-dependent oxidoreductase [Acidimicrobiales bacterium]
MTEKIPEDLLDLVERPLFASVGTIRPNSTVQVNPMWFVYDGEMVRLTHNRTRAKYRNLQLNPSMCLLIVDPDNPIRYLEIRGRLVETTPDPEGEFFVKLAGRYGMQDAPPPPDKEDRVVLVMSIDRTTRFHG